MCNEHTNNNTIVYTSRNKINNYSNNNHNKSRLHQSGFMQIAPSQSPVSQPRAGGIFSRYFQDEGPDCECMMQAYEQTPLFGQTVLL